MTTIPIRPVLIVYLVVWAAENYFGIVFPPKVAKTVAACVGVIEIASILFLGAELTTLRLFFALLIIATPVAALPAVVWVLQYFGVNHYVAIPAASGLLSCSVLFVAGHGAGREGARLYFLILTLFSMIAVAAAALGWGLYPAGTAALSSAATLYAARYALVLPSREDKLLRTAAVICLCVAAVELAFAFILGVFGL